MGVARSQCIVVEDCPPGRRRRQAAGMTAIGFIGGSHAGAKPRGASDQAGARDVIADMRQLKSTVVAIRGW